MDLVRFHYGENNINTGPLKEIPEICVDHFFGNDLNSSVFLLYHAHTDHLVGLETEAFIRRLRQPGIKLYCHPITPILLGSFVRYLGGPNGIRKLVAERKIVPLDVNKPRIIQIPRGSGHLDVTLTLLPAGHCPGSVMFLLETSAVRILHTADFRLTLADLKNMRALHEDGAVKKIDHLYVDTTFCSKSANLFPDRKVVLNDAFREIHNWIGQSKDHIISLSFSAKFAHEYVLQEINKEFQQKIHVTPERQDIYKHIPGVYEIVTLDNDTQFHLCGNRNCVENGEALTVRLSSMWYTKTKEENRDSFISWRGRRNMTLCYSMHSSLGEIAQTVDYLRPQIVTPLVLPVKSNVGQIRVAICSATQSPFRFEDYYSSRNDFDGLEIPEVPCIEERDQTDEVDVNTDNDEKEMLEDSPSREIEEMAAKRIKLSEDQRSAWTFKFSPSPKSKSSQSSSEDGSQNGSEESQVLSLQGCNEDNFCKPVLPLGRLNARRNLAETSFNCGTNKDENLHEVEVKCYENSKGDVGDDDDYFENSQRL